VGVEVEVEEVELWDLVEGGELPVSHDYLDLLLKN
jgi:hypothetical protein